MNARCAALAFMALASACSATPFGGASGKDNSSQVGSASVAFGSPADRPLYVDNNAALFGFDPESYELERIGAFTLKGVTTTDITDIAIDGSGHMYAISMSELYSVEPTTAELQPVLAHQVKAANGLTFLMNGDIVVAGASVVSINLSTQARTVIVPDGVFQTSGDIALLPDGNLYWSVITGGGRPDKLVRVTPNGSDSKFLVVGDLSEDSVLGLAFAAGQFFGFDANGCPSSIDTDTGYSQRLNNCGLGPVAFDGAAGNPGLW